MATIKYDKIDLKTKVEIINLVKCGMKKEEVRKKFNLKNRANINRIMNNEEKILEAFENLNKKYQNKTFRIKDALYPEVKKAIAIWMKQLISKNISISGHLIKSKAVEYAVRLGIRISNQPMDTFVA